MNRKRWLVGVLLASFMIAAIPAAAHAGAWVRFYTAPSGGVAQNVWKSKDMTSNGKFRYARVSATISGCSKGGKAGAYCTYGDIAAPGAGSAYGITPVTMSFSYRTGVFKCRWSAPGGGKASLKCDVGVP